MTDDVFGPAPLTVLVIIGVVAMVVAGIISAVEVALSKLSRAAVEDLVEEGRRHADLLDALLTRRRRTNFSLRGTRTFLQVVGSVAFTLALVRPPLPWWAIGLIAVVAVGVLQFALVSVVPLRIASRTPESVALWGATWTTRLVSASHFGDPAIRMVKGWLPQPSQTEAEARQEMTDDLREMVDQVGETEGFEDEDREMLRSVFELGHTLVREVMVPRTDMVTVEAEIPARKALRLFVRSGFSRIPVVGDDVDEVRGVLYFKDLVARLSAQPEAQDMVAEQMMRPAEFTVEMKPADDLLRQMQSEHYHMALVVDEYGGISGLVTLEDLLEEVVGELTDEHDRNVAEVEKVSAGVWRVPSRYPIDELGELLGLEVEDEDVDSVGGLLGKAIGRVPLPGATGDLLGIHMVAEEARGRRRQVGTILCSRTPEPPRHGGDDEDGPTTGGGGSGAPVTAGTPREHPHNAVPSTTDKD